MTLKRGDKVQLVSLNLFEARNQENAKFYETLPGEFRELKFKLGDIGTIIRDEGEDGLAQCSFGWPTIYVSAAMVEVIPND